MEENFEYNSIKGIKMLFRFDQSCFIFSLTLHLQHCLAPFDKNNPLQPSGTRNKNVRMSDVSFVSKKYGPKMASLFPPDIQSKSSSAVIFQSALDKSK